MKKKMLNSWRIVGGILIIGVIVQACQKDYGLENFNLSVAKTLSVSAAHDNQQMIATIQEVAGVTAGAFTNQGITVGRVADDGMDGELDCKATVTSDVSFNRTTDSLIYFGTITIDYGDGTNCADSLEMRKGKVIDSFRLVVRLKDSLWYQLTEKVKFVNYSRDSMQLNGSISIASSTGQPTIISIDETKIKYHDGTMSSWTGNVVFTTNNGLNDHWGGTIDVTGSWSGTTRSGASFTATITKAIEFKSSCFAIRRMIPVSGTVDVTVAGVDSTIDYGDGTCDKIYTITTAGVTTQHTFRKGEC